MPDLLSGNDHFLFADVKNGTRLLQHLGDRYTVVLAQYRRLLRVAAHNQRGHELDFQGDAGVFAFPSAACAVSAAVDAVRSIRRYPRPTGIVVKVKVGLHSGAPMRIGDGYPGPEAQQAAQICAAGHGWQILLSQATCDLVSHDPPAGMSIRDLGEHRLKDLARPRRLFQVAQAGLPVEFPPLNSLTVLPNNLPVELTCFIGREREIAEVRRLLATTRILTLTGAGGVGKTRPPRRVRRSRHGDVRPGRRQGTLHRHEIHCFTGLIGRAMRGRRSGDGL